MSLVSILGRIRRVHLPYRLTRGIRVTYNQLRVNRLVTRILGPQFCRSRRTIEIDITYVCNMNCFNCNRSIDQARTNEHMSVRQIEQFLNESREKRIYWKRIRLLGGEPTLHREFFEILELCRAYKRDFSALTMIEVATNGHGKRVQDIIARIPADVSIRNSAKENNSQPEFASFNVAPVDLDKFNCSDFRNGCSVLEDCGFGLTPSGYYPCAIAGSIDRIFGWNLGRQQLPEDADTMEDLLQRFCKHCGHFKRDEGPALFAPIISGTWRHAYDQYKQGRPKLSLYGQTAAGGSRQGRVIQLREATINESRNVPKADRKELTNGVAPSTGSQLLLERSS